MKVLVLGDRIQDHYSFCKATRLCPEAPAPVLVLESSRSSNGGASLVANQLEVFMNSNDVVKVYGSMSEKHRIFASGQMICRMDNDSQSIMPYEVYWTRVNHELIYVPDAVVVGDYGKGAMAEQTAKKLTITCAEKGIPLFVDSKNNPEPYKGCFAIFPNENEHVGQLPQSDYQNIIRKLGKNGCMVNGQHIPTKEQAVFDVTGAGDIFLAAFVHNYLQSKDLISAAKFANLVAGLSVRHIGTYVVPLNEIVG